jgi:hypothetical protein
MKLTWFGGTTLRIHIGGRILVVEPAGISGVDEAELASGADRVFGLLDEMPQVDAQSWVPRSVPTLLSEDEPPAVSVYRLELTAVLIDAVGEPPLVLASGPISVTGRWGTSAIVVVLGPEPNRTAFGVLDVLVPRLIAVAGDEAAVGSILGSIGDRLGGTGFMAMEPGLALEV